MEKITEESLEEFNGSNECSLDDQPQLPEEHDLENKDNYKVYRKRSYWRKPATKVYADNFGFSVNGYQPMIDYLDKKDSGSSVDKSEVHLPFLEERCLNKYSSQKPFKLYKNKDIDKFIDKGERICTQIRQNDAIGISNVLRRTHTNWSMTKKYVQLVKNSFVLDFRKLHPDKNLGEIPKCSVFTGKALVPKFTLSALLSTLDLPDMDSGTFLATYVRNRLDHANEMAARREKLRALDDDYEQTLKKLAFTVDRINNRVETVPVIISPSGLAYHPKDMIDVADDLIHNNRMKRQQDLYRLACDVSSVIEGTPRFRPMPQLSEHYHRIDPTQLAITQRNAEAALLARNKSFPPPAYEEADVDELRDRYLNRNPHRPEFVEVEPPRRIKKQQEDVISDVQTRIMNRAREMGGVSSEARRINKMAKFVNTVSPRPDTGAVDLRVPPSRTERNIVNMANSLAYTSKPVRRYDVDDEVDEPVSGLNTFATKTYCNREFERPILEVPSDSSYVRDANMRARNRNALLGN